MTEGQSIWFTFLIIVCTISLAQTISRSRK